MKLELRENMYVRNCYGRIAKIEYIEDNTAYCDNWLYQSYEDHITFINLDDEDDIDEILKTSYNIIDLIEEKDLLEIEYFSLRYEKRVTRLFEVTYKEGRFINLDNAKCQFMLIDNDWTDNDKELEPIIKSIVTHEQMEQMTYKVGE